MLIPYKQYDMDGNRFNRQEISTARNFLRFCTTSILKPHKQLKWKPANIEKDTNTYISVIGRMHPPDIANFLLVPIAKIFPGYKDDVENEIYYKIVEYICLLSGDHALSTYFPFRFHDRLLQTCQKLMSDGCDNLTYIKDIGIELYDLLSLVSGTPTLKFVCAFVASVILFVREIHSGDHSTDEPVPIPGTYNPSSGMAYYFTKHGCQLRKQPEYHGFPNSNKTTDTPNEIDDDCTKIYPGISPGGYASCMFMFCPHHFHCYGFHLIQGSEGRKDVFSAMYKFKPSPPKEFFYDFACNLSEYCLNREPSFFCCTRFWHDIFHSITHLCGDGFKSERVIGLQGINTEVCEQFNSFLQCIKFTASHLSQVHFMLFTQFMVCLWNRDKTERYKRRQAIMFAAMM